MDRVFDLVCLLLFSFVALLYFQINFKIIQLPKDNTTFLFWLIGLFIMLITVFVFRIKFKNILSPWWKAFTSHDLGFVKSIQSFLLTCLSMTLIYGVFNYIAFVMKIEIDHLGLFLGTFVLGVLTLLPITILGIGVRETSLVLIFQLYELPAQDAIALSLIIFFIQLVSLIPGAIWFYLSPIQLKDLKSKKTAT